MPSKTFFNLPDIKQKKLIQAALDEFSNNGFIDVSINRIINSASIPRGSFYMYFNSKEDLFEYLLESYTIKLKDIVSDVLLKNNGDLRNSYMFLYDETISRVKKIEYKTFFRNVFIYLNLNRDKFLYKGHLLFEEIEKNINRDNIKSEDLEFIFMMLMQNLFISVSDSLHTGDEKLEKERYLRKLDMICYGFYKNKKRGKYEISE